MKQTFFFLNSAKRKANECSSRTYIPFSDFTAYISLMRESCNWSFSQCPTLPNQANSKTPPLDHKLRFWSMKEKRIHIPILLTWFTVLLADIWHNAWMGRFNEYLGIRMLYIRKIFFSLLPHMKSKMQNLRFKYCENGSITAKTIQKCNFKKNIFNSVSLMWKKFLQVLALQVKIMLVTFRWSGKSKSKKRNKKSSTLQWLFFSFLALKGRWKAI